LIYIPISEQEFDTEQVKNATDSLKKYGYEYTFVSSPEYAKRGSDHLKNILINGNKIFDLAFKNKEKYICTQESSVVHLVGDNIEVMEKYLDDNPKCGAVFIDPSKNNVLRNVTRRLRWLCIMRAEAVKDFRFKLDKQDRPCDCEQLPDYLRENGWSADWLEQKEGRIFKPQVREI